MFALPLAAFRNRISLCLAQIRRPEVLVFLPAITLAGFWLGGERTLLVLALGMPFLFVLAPRPARPPESGSAEEASVSRAIATIDALLPMMVENGRSTACVVVQFDDLHHVLERHGRAAHSQVLARAIDRIHGTLRVGDVVTRPQGDSIAIVLTPVRRLDLETMVQLCVRLQEGMAEPVFMGGAQLYVTASLGFCIAGGSPEATGRSLLDAAQMAADEALRCGPGAIRAYSADMARRHADRDALRDDLDQALERGEIRPHFQPQISTETGEISGFEALARWYHPTRGCLPPAEFLPALESGDMCDRLGETMLFHSLSALSEWDRAGLIVPTVAVNFSASELRNPRLLDRIRWELQRFAMQPERLTIEILETVIAQTENDVIVSNIAQLAQLGCGVDLDDFGTGNASIGAIRRFDVRRLKIDRSFVTGISQDREQQRMVAAIISLADQLGLATLAEGVENAADHAMLGHLGCAFVQGFGLGLPMPQEDAAQWIASHQSRPDRIPRIVQRHA